MSSLLNLPILFLGDSDITHWSALPSNSLTHATSGFTSIDVLNSLSLLSSPCSSKDNGNDSKEVEEVTHCVMVCGENDLSCSIEISYIHSVVSTIKDTIASLPSTLPMLRHLLFLGPKLEPWQSNNLSSILSYLNLHNQLSYSLPKLEIDNLQITYIDNFSKFTTSSKLTYDLGMFLRSLKEGEVLEFEIERKWFKEDCLHLSEEGYGVWEGIVREWYIDTIK
ncbi:hypothetical protein TrLO_g1762 [Triparma laevis f. longispina]|uniref:Uncharacterized protein n=1 Tax=Triparma laevis f. longispina TaxID=1714387 RepID=A0A9W7F2I2_9STRA|nr:hypothetical protein TrLO_g1762 [Triparma laevis f. longispina]